MGDVKEFSNEVGNMENLFLLEYIDVHSGDFHTRIEPSHKPCINCLVNIAHKIDDHFDNNAYSHLNIEFVLLALHFSFLFLAKFIVQCKTPDIQSKNDQHYSTCAQIVEALQTCRAKY